MGRVHDRHGTPHGSHWDQAENVLKFMVFENPNWDFRKFDYDKDVNFALENLGRRSMRSIPDLTRFRQRGAKLISITDGATRRSRR